MLLEDFRKWANEVSGSVFSTFVELQDILERYEDMIRTQWAKKTRAQRQRILVEAWYTDLPRSHRPDPLDFRKAETQTNSDDEDEDDGNVDNDSDKKIDVYQWPHVSLEDLLPPATLLRLLNTRSRKSPSAFAAMNWDCTELGREA
jgi:hypothetical protein